MASAAAIRVHGAEDAKERLTRVKGLTPITTTIQIRPSATLAPATAISPGPLAPSTPTLCTGPASGIATILPRPKPGRKPASDEPENKRKAQNRAAQRAFRERKMQGQQALEHENKDLKFMNDQLVKEVQQLRDTSSNSLSVQTRLKAELAESLRREAELRTQQEQSSSRLAAYERRVRDAEAMTARYQRELETLQAELSSTRKQLEEMRAAPQVMMKTTVSDDAATRHAATGATDGCGNCEENGACPCVDTYLEAVPVTRIGKPAPHRPSTMSIDTLLSPSQQEPSDRINSIPELVSDHSSPEDLEIDFTHALRPATTGLRQIPKSEKCGLCEDGGKCICAEAEAEIDINMRQSTPALPSATVQQPQQSSTSQPGTCAQCQRNPEQKAYCESLARTRATARSPDAEEQHRAKRARTGQRDLSVPCADAFQLYKRYSAKPEAPSYDEVYQDYVKTNRGNRRTARPGGSEALKPRQFSAYETDIAAVIATLHRQPTGDAAGTAGKGAKT